MTRYLKSPEHYGTSYGHH
ncbi:hypothetical protein ACM6WB_003384 [Vibrio vulnificus]